MLRFTNQHRIAAQDVSLAPVSYKEGYKKSVYWQKAFEKKREDKNETQLVRPAFDKFRGTCITLMRTFGFDEGTHCYGLWFR